MSKIFLKKRNLDSDYPKTGKEKVVSSKEPLIKIHNMFTDKYLDDENLEDYEYAKPEFADTSKYFLNKTRIGFYNGDNEDEYTSHNKKDVRDFFSNPENRHEHMMDTPPYTRTYNKFLKQSKLKQDRENERDKDIETRELGEKKYISSLPLKDRERVPYYYGGPLPYINGLSYKQTKQAYDAAKNVFDKAQYFNPFIKPNSEPRIDKIKSSIEASQRDELDKSDKILKIMKDPLYNRSGLSYGDANKIYDKENAAKKSIMDFAKKTFPWQR